MGLFFALLSMFMGTPDQRCISTVFGTPGDKWAGGDALYLKRPVGPDDVGIAHRRLALGSQVLIRNERTGMFVVATVIDRGPYGAMHEGKWVLKRRRRDPGKWRGCADLTPMAATLIGHDGWDRISLWSLADDEERRDDDRTRERRSREPLRAVDKRQPQGCSEGLDQHVEHEGCVRSLSGGHAAGLQGRRGDRGS